MAVKLALWKAEKSVSLLAASMVGMMAASMVVLTVANLASYWVGWMEHERVVGLAVMTVCGWVDAMVEKKAG